MAFPFDTNNAALNSFLGSSNDSGIPSSADISASQQSKLQSTYAKLISKLEDVNAKHRSLITAAQYGSNLYNVPREPWVFATFAALRKAGAPLSNADGVALTGFNDTTLPQDSSVVWVANPQSVGWQINQRGTETKNKSGTVLHLWPNSGRKTFYDDPKISMTFQSGNIMPMDPNISNPSAASNNPQISGGLNNFYQFLSLVDQPKINPDGTPNLIYILYHSRIFPSLTITGFFDPQLVVQFTDSAEAPNKVTGWTANFTVYSTVPQLKDFKQLTGMFASDGLTNFQGR